MAKSSHRIDTAFLRGGTSKGLFFTEKELPLAVPAAGQVGATELESLRRRDLILCAALGSPDPFGRQLDGMGGGVSSLSKAVIVGQSKRAGIDLEYTFAQIPVYGTDVDYSGNCGNLSSGVVPFALETGMLTRADGLQQFSLFNVNTSKVVSVRLTVENGQAATSGNLTLPGVAGTGSLIELAYPEPGGSRTRGVLSTGLPAESFSVAGRTIRASIVDATIPLVIVPAAELGLTGAELPALIESRSETMSQIEELRRLAAVRAGLCADTSSAPLFVPKVVLVSPKSKALLLNGDTQLPEAADLLARTISMERAHGAIPGTAAMCIAAAAVIPGTVVADILPQQEITPEGTLAVRIGTPSGTVTAMATTDSFTAPGGTEIPHIAETALARTARVLMRGQVAVEI